MPEQVLNDSNIDALLQQVRGEAVPQRMHGDIVVETGCIGGIAKSALYRSRRRRQRLIRAGEQPMWRVSPAPIITKDDE